MSGSLLRRAVIVAALAAAPAATAAPAVPLVAPPCDGRPATIVGTDGDDTIRGTAGADVIVTGEGDDVVEAGPGDDLVRAGPGNDTVAGGGGADTLLGGGDDDFLRGETGPDVLRGGPGWDQAYGGGGPDQISGDDGGDQLAGGQGRDSIGGGPGDDVLLGGIGDDILAGGADRDHIYGGEGADQSSGGDGADTLSGEAGPDRLDGGEGADLLQGGDDDDSLHGGAGADIAIGSAGDDYLAGDDGDDTLRGDAGADRCDGGYGVDGAATCEALAGTETGQVARPLLHPGPGQVALTFDDGPAAAYTGQILDILARYGVPATFFVVGRQAEAQPGLLERMAAEGHSVQNHTYGHYWLTRYTDETIRGQLTAAGDVIAGITGDRPHCLRPPFGAINDRVRALASRQGLATVMWDVDPWNWSRPGASAVASRVLHDTTGGDIVLFHDTAGASTVGALPAIIEALRARGLEFVAICSTPVLAPG